MCIYDRVNLSSNKVYMTLMEAATTIIIEYVTSISESGD